MSQAAVVLEPVTYSRRRRSLANALAQAGLHEDDLEEAEEAVTAPARPEAVLTFEPSARGVFEVVDETVRTRPTSRTGTPRTRTDGRRISNWMPAGYKPEPLEVLKDPAKASDLPWLKAKRKGRFIRKVKVFTAWVATLAITCVMLAGAASLMGVYPWPKGLPDLVAHK